ncbi:hypothetical protein SNEBB_008682 [Seison nebaliae]|nr:hypothetical protein SNEBB_008682 [Seison nebaliae]
MIHLRDLRRIRGNLRKVNNNNNNHKKRFDWNGFVTKFLSFLAIAIILQMISFFFRTRQYPSSNTSWNEDVVKWSKKQIGKFLLDRKYNRRLYDPRILFTKILLKGVLLTIIFFYFDFLRSNYQRLLRQAIIAYNIVSKEYREDEHMQMQTVD